jgi:hypothetical protein
MEITDPIALAWLAGKSIQAAQVAPRRKSSPDGVRPVPSPARWLAARLQDSRSMARIAAHNLPAGFSMAWRKLD